MQVVFFNEIKFSHESSFSMQIVFFFNESKFSMQGGFKKKMKVDFQCQWFSNISSFSMQLIFQCKQFFNTCKILIRIFIYLIFFQC
jgi:hypothetical protein